MSREIVSEKEVMNDLRSNPNARLLKSEAALKHDPWSMERVLRCVALIRLRMGGDLSEITKEQDEEMAEFFALHENIVKLATSSKEDDQFALDKLLALYSQVRVGKMTKREMSSKLYDTLVDGKK